METLRQRDYSAWIKTAKCCRYKQQTKKQQQTSDILNISLENFEFAGICCFHHLTELINHNNTSNEQNLMLIANKFQVFRNVFLEKLPDQCLLKLSKVT